MNKPTLSEVFPDPFSRQWPSTAHPTTAECRQLYALVSICCCVPHTHLLVLHESRSKSVVTCMPRGPKYIEYHINGRTTAEDLCGYLIRAELASATISSAHSTPREAAELFSPSTPREAASGFPILTRRGSSSLANSSKKVVVVVCLHGIAQASSSVVSALMDVLTFGQVADKGNHVKEVPSLRIVAFCEYTSYVTALPVYLRAAFALSTYMSALSMDSAVVLQSSNPRTSTVVNKRYLTEVATSSDGQQLLETVQMSALVSRYLRHLILVIRGSMYMCYSPGSLATRRIPYYLTLLKAASLLFYPEDAANASGRRSSLDSSPQRPTHHHARVNSLRFNYADASRVGAGRQLSTFAFVVVSPADVVCLLPSLLGHLLDLPRALHPGPDILAASDGDRLLNDEGCSLRIAFTGEESVSPVEMGDWDARAAAWMGPPCGGGRPMFASSSTPEAPLGGSSAAAALELSVLSHRPSMKLIRSGGGGASGPAFADTVVGGRLGESFFPTAAVGTLPVNDQNYLHYDEVKEMIRATLIARSAPAPG